MNRVGMPVRRRRAAPCYIFEGLWWQTREVPQVLPFLQALAAFDGGLSLSHRTFRTGDDLRYWFSRIPKGDRSLVYIACHGRDGNLKPVDGRSQIKWEELIEALRAAKPGAIEFLHFGACEIVEEGNRRQRLEALGRFRRSALSLLLSRADQVYGSTAHQEVQATEMTGRALPRTSLGEGDAFGNALRFAYADIVTRLSS